MISKEEVEKIAKLARLELTPEEVVKMQKDLSEVLDYFNALQKVDSKSYISSNIPRGNNLRKDEGRHRDEELVEKLLEQAPDKKDEYIKVKSIF
ncbi:MAG: Asp-tRNA(Asn)/Glu-tRNA(Gln) amidotransferase subunit GatC [Candidatus Staskawiczbacteria bacterium]|jgi:aspartyl-tRNA(Asn)/glutamyl-tRNA(Gln) amidotransferase subunit C